jgi:hypothetical protein
MPLDRIRGSRWIVVVGLALLMLVSALLRVRGIHLYYWIDEGLSVGIASHPFAHIPSLLRQDGSPPLYYLLLHVWMALRGTNEVATHELSLIFALLTIPVAYWAGTTLFGRRSGAISAVLAAGVPYLTAYAQETRMYALLTLLALIASASFVHVFVFRHRRQIPVFALSLTAALYTHNWALFFALMTGAAFLLCVASQPHAERRALLIDGALAFGAVALLFAPWVPTLLYQAKHTGAPWALAPVIWSLSQGLYSLVGGRGAAIALLLAGGTGLVALSGQGVGAVPLRERLRRPQTGLVLAAECLVLLGIGTLLVAWLYAKVTPAWAVRYLGVIVGPLILLFAAGLARAGRLGWVALALVVSFWVLDPVPTALSSKSNVAAVAARIRPHVRPSTLVLSTQPEQVPTIAHYLPVIAHFGTPLGPVHDPRVMDWINALHRLRHSSVHSVLMPMVDRLSPGQRLLLVIPTNLPKTPLWLKLIDRDSTRWFRALWRDPRLRFLTATGVGSSVSGSGVRAALFEVR